MGDKHYNEVRTYCIDDFKIEKIYRLGCPTSSLRKQLNQCEF